MKKTSLFYFSGIRSLEWLHQFNRIGKGNRIQFKSQIVLHLMMRKDGIMITFFRDHTNDNRAFCTFRNDVDSLDQRHAAMLNWEEPTCHHHTLVRFFRSGLFREQITSVND